MAISAISSVSGGYTRLLRAQPGGDSPASETGAAENVATATEGPDTSPDRAVLDEASLAEGSKRAQAERARGAQSLEERVYIASLQARDAEVRRHEAAHLAAGDGYVVGGATYTYQIGPDGRHYAVGGKVEIDTSPIPGKPEETVRKMRIVKAAALASGQPSAADLAVAAAAAQAEAAALAEIAAANAKDFAARYSGEMEAASRDAGAAPASFPRASGTHLVLRDDGPPPTPFDVIA